MQRRQALLVALGCALALLAPASAFAGTLSANPSPLHFGAQQIDFGRQSRNVGIINDNSATTLGTATITGPDAAAFQISGNDCDGSSRDPNSGCSINVDWTPALPAGAKSAQLEIPYSGTLSPLVVPLTATALAGPRSVITPSTINFGNTALGAARSQLVSVSNSGDADLFVQQAFIVGGTPSFFPISANTCTGHPIAPDSGCSFVVGFAPATAGLKEGSVFLITNENGPVTTLAVSGTAYPAPAGAATVTGAAQVGSGLGCEPVGFSPGVSFAYQWLRNGAAISGAIAAGYAPVDADVGARLSCSISASNPLGTATVTSPQTAPVAPRSLSGLSGAFVGQDSCRIARVASSLRIGSHTVKIRSGSPLTPAEPLTVSSRGASSLQLSVDGQPLARGRAVATLAPRSLAPFAASSTLGITVDGASGSTGLALAPCLLAVRLTGASDRPSWLAISARTAASKATIQLPSSLRLRTRGYLGRATIRSFGAPAQIFQLHGSATTYNDVTVRISKSRVKVSGLPEQTGVVSLNFTAGALTGRPGTVTAAASLLSAGTQSARALADFTP
jgi:hypothetical protein